MCSVECQCKESVISIQPSHAWLLPLTCCSLKKQMQEQKYRCAGCRMEVEHSLAKYYRYCYYYGKYFCQNCHSNKKAVLPALVIREWNFKKKMVSNIAFGLLSEIEDIPHYNMSELNKEFYTRVVPMQTMLWLRRQLQLTRQYIATCRLASDLTVHYEELGHLVTDVHMYSLKDLIKMESGELQLLVRHLIDQSIEHVKSCDVCKFKGHYCEICQNGVDIIYPFEVRRVVQCPQCFACYHRGCFKKESDPCPKCVRLRAWKTKASVGQRPDLNWQLSLNIYLYSTHDMCCAFMNELTITTCICVVIEGESNW